MKKLLAFIRKVRALLRCTGVLFTGRIESQVIVSRQIVFTPVPRKSLFGVTDKMQTETRFNAADVYSTRLWRFQRERDGSGKLKRKTN